MNNVRNKATYITIDDGNDNNDTPDFNSGTGDSSFRTKAGNSKYGSQWKNAFNKISNKVDFSDSVEVLHIMGIPKNSIPDTTAFGAMFF